MEAVNHEERQRPLRAADPLSVSASNLFAAEHRRFYAFLRDHISLMQKHTFGGCSILRRAVVETWRIARDSSSLLGAHRQHKSRPDG